MRPKELEMSREFVSLPSFERAWKELGLTDLDMLRLQTALMKNPEEGDVIPESHGCRKLRFAPADQGKRGGDRVIYFDYVKSERLYLIDAYAKSEKENPSREEIKYYADIADKIKAGEKGAHHHDKERVQRKPRGS